MFSPTVSSDMRLSVKPAEVGRRAAARPPARQPAEVDGRAAARPQTAEPIEVDGRASAGLPTADPAVVGGRAAARPPHAEPSEVGKRVAARPLTNEAASVIRRPPDRLWTAAAPAETTARRECDRAAVGSGGSAAGLPDESSPAATSFSLFGVWTPRKQWAQLAVRKRRIQRPLSPERVVASRQAAAAEATAAAVTAAAKAAAAAATAAAESATAQAAYRESAAVTALAKRVAKRAQATAARAAVASKTAAAAVSYLTGRHVLPQLASAAGAPAAGVAAERPTSKRLRVGCSGSRPPLHPSSRRRRGGASK